MEVFSKTDIGNIRSSNQDSCYVSKLSENAVWAVVCDGMGGANGGNVASSVAVETIKEVIQNNYKDDLDKNRTVELLTDAVQQANAKLYKMQSEDSSLRGMGTTVELVMVKDGFVHVVHAGDSRVYGVRGNKMQQITVDHSVVQEMVEKGELTQEEARVHPNKNYITRALGINPDIHLDYIETPYQSGDIIIICTDGLSNHLTSVDILSEVLNNDWKNLPEVYVAKAKELGGSDNITVAVIY